MGVEGEKGEAVDGGQYGSLFATDWEFGAAANELVLRSGSEELRLELPTPGALDAGRYWMSREYWDLVVLRAEVVEYVHRSGMEIFGNKPLVRDGKWVWH